MIVKVVLWVIVVYCGDFNAIKKDGDRNGIAPMVNSGEIVEFN